VREYEEGAFYHVYNRGVEKRKIFIDKQDYTIFLGLLKKYLANDSVDSNKNNRHRFQSIENEVALLAYCLMPNHIHLLLRNDVKQGVERLMRRVMTGYVMYFNNKYSRVGSLFQGPYKASRITTDAYMYHISRYIHLNPDAYKTWPYSSYKYYVNVPAPKWLRVDDVLQLFTDKKEYVAFVADHVDMYEELQALKWQLANNVEREEM
jgi:REP element-mobilizing transposase RayT